MRDQNVISFKRNVVNYFDNHMKDAIEATGRTQNSVLW